MDQLDPHIFGDGQPCFGCSPDHPTGFRLTFEREGDDVVSRFVPGRNHQGPPGVMHGGLVLTLADEVGAWTVLGLLEKFGFTAQLDSKLRAPIRIGKTVEARGRIAAANSRVVRVAISLTQGDVLCAEANAAFVLLDQHAAEKLLDAPMPDSWKRFCRTPSKTPAP